MEMTEPFKRQTRCGGGWPGARVRRWELFSLWLKRDAGHHRESTVTFDTSRPDWNVLTTVIDMFDELLARISAFLTSTW